MMNGASQPGLNIYSFASYEEKSQNQTPVPAAIHSLTRLAANSILHLSCKQISKMNYPDSLRYTKDHEWIRIEGDEAVIGITEFAQHELGDIVYVEVETVGRDLNAGDVFGTVEAVKTVSDLYLPVAGSITAVNPNLNANPELVNSDPYGEGWMVRMKLANPQDAEELMDAAAYGELVG